MPNARFIGLEHIEPHTMRLLGTTPTSDVRSSAAYFAPGDVLYGRLRPYLNKVYRPGFEGLASAEFIVFPIEAAVSGGYLQYFLNSSEFCGHASHQVSGDRPRVDFSQLGEFRFPLAPLPEQHRIVAEIEKQLTRLDAAIAALNHARAKLKRYRASMLKAACEGRLMPRESDWRLATVSNVADSFKNGIYKPREFYAEEGTACLRMYNIDSGRIVWKQIKRMRLTEEERREYALLPGDILVNRVNSRELVGKAAVITGQHEFCVFESKNVRLRLVRDVVEPAYLAYCMAANGQAYFNRNAQQVVGMASISQGQIGAFPFLLPSLAEQRRIVAEAERRLAIWQATNLLIDVNMHRAERLRQAILKIAFEGRLVAQDRRDEPVSALLNRIKAERASVERASQRHKPATRRPAGRKARAISREVRT